LRRAILIEGDEKDSPESKMLSPDLPLLLITHPESRRSKAEGSELTIEGKSKSVRGIREVRIEGRSSRVTSAHDEIVIYSAPVSVDEAESGNEIGFKCEYKDLQPGENVVRVKIIDSLGFSAERYLVVDQ
jgi:hypothetical protein